jgi:hypothetical protein
MSSSTHNLATIVSFTAKETVPSKSRYFGGFVKKNKARSGIIAKRSGGRTQYICVEHPELGSESPKRIVRVSK